jgi:hypothetical protein
MTENLYIAHCVGIEIQNIWEPGYISIFSLKNELIYLFHEVQRSRLLKYFHKLSEVSTNTFMFILKTKGYAVGTWLRHRATSPKSRVRFPMV